MRVPSFQIPVSKKCYAQAQLHCKTVMKWTEQIYQIHQIYIVNKIEIEIKNAKGVKKISLTLKGLLLLIIYIFLREQSWNKK